MVVKLMLHDQRFNKIGDITGSTFMNPLSMGETA